MGRSSDGFTNASRHAEREFARSKASSKESRWRVMMSDFSTNRTTQLLSGNTLIDIRPPFCAAELILRQDKDTTQKS